MNDPLRPQLAKKSILIKFDEGELSHSAMLSLDDNEKFEIKWNGDHEPGRVIASYSDGYLSFFTNVAAQFFGVKASSTMINPKTILSARRKDLVEAEKFDCVMITYNNIFTGFQYNPNKLHPIDVLKAVGKDIIEIGDGIELSIIIGSTSETRIFPISSTSYLDDLNFIFKGDSKFKLADVNKYFETVTKVISLFLAKPIDPKAIYLGLKQDNLEGVYDFAILEYDKKYDYVDLKRDTFYPIDVNQAKSMADALMGAFNIDLNRELSVWFSFTEADYKKYYLDTIMSILLSCAESTYYLLPTPDTSKGEQEFDAFLQQIEGINIQPPKLAKFIKGARGAYLDRMTFETKIMKLIEFCDLKMGNKEVFARYLNQLRNNLMHGTAPNFDHLVDKERKPIQSINIMEILNQLRTLVSSSLIKYLVESK